MHNVSRRLVHLIILLALTVPAVYYGISYVRTPELFAEDVLEVRACRMCGGTGVDEEMARDYPELGNRCSFCRGDGKVDVILPGPNRPVRLRGLVRDQSQIHDFSRFAMEFGEPPPRPRPFQKPEGAVAGARVTIQGYDEVFIELESNPHGRFAARLLPGAYRIEVAADGFVPLAGTFEVPVLTEPIWLEEAKLIREPDSGAEALSLYGLDADVRLVRSGKSSVSVRPGAP